jgi:hypothetical protein
MMNLALTIFIEEDALLKENRGFGETRATGRVVIENQLSIKKIGVRMREVSEQGRVAGKAL